MGLLGSLKLTLYHPAVLSILVVTAALFVVPEPADACAPAPPRNQSVEIASESAIIAWDEGTKTQHFIRRASFRSDADDTNTRLPPWPRFPSKRTT